MTSIQKTTLKLKKYNVNLATKAQTPIIALDRPTKKKKEIKRKTINTT